MSDIHENDGLPAWYQEIFPAGPHDGFYEKLGDHAAVFIKRDPAHLVITFDNLSDAGNPRFDAGPWAEKFIREKGWSHLGILASGPTWYRDARIIALFERLSRESFFTHFGHVSLTGTSMGGFAALVFAKFVPNAIVVALSPQSTLDPQAVPWERRFMKGQAQDWTLPCSDAAKTLGDVRRAYVLYDPWVENDLRQVMRLPQERLVHLKAFWFGHKTAMVMRRMDQLKPFMEAALQGTLTEAQFYAMIRNRKDILIYRREVEAVLIRQNREHLIKRFRRAFRLRRLSSQEKS